MSDMLADWFVHTVTVRRFSGTGAKGTVYASPDTLMGFVDDSNKLIRDAQGQQVVSSARVFFPAGTDPIPLQSEVTRAGPFLGRITQVIDVSVHDAGSQDTPNHVEVSLQQMPIAWVYTPPKINAAELIVAAVPDATHAAADHLLAASQGLVPVDTGALKASGQVRQEGTKATVSYDVLADDGYPYGIRQHEDMSLHHPNGGQAKFLEQPMHTEAGAMRAIVAERIIAVLHL